MGKTKVVPTDKSELKKKRAAFTIDETHELLRIWASEEIQQLFGTTIRHNLVWNSIAAKHRSMGFCKTGPEVKSKIGNLKTEYRAVKPKSGGEPPTWPFFEGMHKVLGQRDCVNDDLLDDSLTRECEDQVDAEDVETHSSARTPIEFIDVDIDHEVQSLDSESQTNHTHENICTRSDSKQIGKKKMQKITRPPRRKGSDENKLISLLVASEKRHNETLAAMEEHERKTQEREALIAQSMNRFLTAFAVLAENQAKENKSLFSPLIAPVVAAPQSFQSTFAGSSSMRHQARTNAKSNTISCSDHVNEYTYTSASPTVPKDHNNVSVDDGPTTGDKGPGDYNYATDFVNYTQRSEDISQFCEFESNKENALESEIQANARSHLPSLQPVKTGLTARYDQEMVGKQTTCSKTAHNIGSFTAPTQFKGISEPTKRAFQKINVKPTKLMRVEQSRIDMTFPNLEADDDDELPAVPWARPVRSTDDENNARQVPVQNVSSTEKRSEAYSVKVNPQSSYNTVPEIKSQQVKLIQLKRPVKATQLNHLQNVPPNACDKKPSIIRKSDGLLYITLAKNN